MKQEQLGLNHIESESMTDDSQNNGIHWELLHV